MKSKTSLVLLLLVAISLVSCGETEKESVVVIPKTTSINGDLKDYFEVVDKEYKIKPDGYSPIITIEIKRTDKDFDFPTDNINPFGTNGSEDYHVGFGIDIFSDSGPEIIRNATSGGMSGPYSNDDVKSLMALDKGETGFIRWSLDNDKIEELIDFRITSALKRKEHNSSSSTGSTSNKVTKEKKSKKKVATTSSNTKVDKALDSYEDYVDKYIEFMIKAKDGDMSAMQEYPALMAKAENMQSDLNDMQSGFSGKQMSRMMKIQQKMFDAVAEMY